MPHKTNIVLIVDKNAQRRSNLATKLRLMGYNVEISDSGFQVIHLLEQAQEFSTKSYSGLIITENSEDMPAREIMLLSRNIYSDKEKFPILYLSKNHDPDDILLTIKEGANEYIVDLENQANVINKFRKHFHSAE